MEDRIAAGIPSYVSDVMAALERAGKRGYPVGGCIRDLLRGVTPHDFDLTTNATPTETASILSHLRIIPTGLAHGTITVLSEGHPVEITTHRTEGSYTDRRHPDSISFTTDLRADLARRDFTVNAMAWHPETGLVDPFDGRGDLARGVIRAVGNPAERFGEDALRILRCFRFAARLNFTVDPATREGARAMRAGLSHVAVERILAELCGLLEAPAVDRGLQALHAADCPPLVFGHLAVDPRHFSLLCSLPPKAPLRLAALLWGNEEAEVKALCQRLHAPNAFTEAVSHYLLALRESPPDDPYTARRFVCHHFQYVEEALALFSALYHIDTEASLTLCRTVLRDKTAIELRRLSVNGRELQEQCGVPPKKTGALLLRLQDLVWRDPSLNRKELLIKEAKRILSEETEYANHAI